MNRPSEPAFLLPNALILDGPLSFTARRVGAVLYSFGSVDLQLTLSTLANMTGISTATLRGNLQELEAAGYICYQKGNRRHPAHIRLLLSPAPGACALIPCSTLSLPLHSSSFCVLLYLFYCGWEPGQEGRPSRRTMQKTLYISKSGLHRSLKEIRAALEEKKT